MTEEESLRLLAADAWDEGYTAGHSNAMRKMSDEPNAPTSPNPYREKPPVPKTPDEKRAFSKAWDERYEAGQQP